MSRLNEIIAVINNKGGVGKTTTVQSIAACLLRLNKKLRILLIDLDPQGNLSLLMGWGSAQKTGDRTIYDALKSGGASVPVYKTSTGLYYSPSSPFLQTVDADLYRAMQPKMVLGACFGEQLDDHTGDGLTNVVEDFDYVFIDCPPSLSECTYNAMAVATGLLVPVQMEGLSVNGLGTIMVELGRVQKALNKGLELRGLLPVMVDARPKIVKEFIDYLHESFGDNVCKTMIRRCVKINEAHTRLQDIYSWAPYCTAAIDYEMLVKELFDKKK